MMLWISGCGTGCVAHRFLFLNPFSLVMLRMIFSAGADLLGRGQAGKLLCFCKRMGAQQAAISERPPTTIACGKHNFLRDVGIAVVWSNKEVLHNAACVILFYKCPPL